MASTTLHVIFTSSNACCTTGIIASIWLRAAISGITPPETKFGDKYVVMHPDDKRNLILFFAGCIALFLVYDIFIGQPHQEALKAEGLIAA